MENCCKHSDSEKKVRTLEIQLPNPWAIQFKCKTIQCKDCGELFVEGDEDIREMLDNFEDEYNKQHL